MEEYAQLQDIAPTLLHLASVSVPDTMDGRILTKLLRPEFRQVEESLRTSSQEMSSRKIEPSEDEEDSEVVLQRLVDSGYLD